MRARALLVPLVMAAAFLAGCTTATPGTDPTPTPTSNGVEALSATEILAKATEAMKGASSFHAKGTGESDGTKTEFDVLMAGADIKGKITFDGVSVDLLMVGGSTYMKGGDDLWKNFVPEQQQAAVIALLSNKWVKMPPAMSGGLLPSVEDLLEIGSTVTKGEVTTVNGQKAITLVDGAKGKLLVATTGKPYPLSVESADGTVTFSDFDKGETVAAPSASETVDLTSVMG